MTYNTWLVMVGVCCAASIPRLCVKYYIKICSTSICLVACWRLIYTPIFSIVDFVIIVGNFVNKHECKYTSYTKKNWYTTKSILAKGVVLFSWKFTQYSLHIVRWKSSNFELSNDKAPISIVVFYKKILKGILIVFDVFAVLSSSFG